MLVSATPNAPKEDSPTQTPLPALSFNNMFEYGSFSGNIAMGTARRHSTLFPSAAHCSWKTAEVTPCYDHLCFDNSSLAARLGDFSSLLLDS